MRDECDGHWIDVVAHMHWANSGDVYGTPEPLETPWHFHAALDHGVKQITRAQLIGYDVRRDLVHLTTHVDSKSRLRNPDGTYTAGNSSQSINVVTTRMVDKIEEDLDRFHKQDPYLILRIPELGESVVSNDKYTNGAFAALATLDARPFIWTHDNYPNSVGDTQDDNKLALGMLFQDYTRHSSCSDPLVSKEINAANSTVRNLTIQINRLNGEPCTDAKSVTLWLRLFVTRG